jgi:hypothetical protein
VLSGQQRGASAARNTALRAARGDFIQYLDADDLLAPTKIAAQLKVAGADDLLLTFGSVIHFDDGRPPEQGLLYPANLAEPLRNPVEFLIDLLGGNGQGWMIQTGQWLVPRRLAELAGEWNESISVDDDGEYFCRVALAARELQPCVDSVCYYRKFARGGNLSAQWSMNHRGAASLLASTRLKAGLLARVTQDPRLVTALVSSYSSLALNCYPVSPDVSAAAIMELRQLNRPLEIKSVTRWFRFFARLGGWKFARRMQHLALRLRHSARPPA